MKLILILSSMIFRNCRATGSVASHTRRAGRLPYRLINIQIILIMSLLIKFSLHGQEVKSSTIPPDDTENNVPILWRCEFDDLSCMVSLSELECVTIQNYVVDGKIEVTETTAVMKTKTFIRFYFIENANMGGLIGERVKEGMDKAETITEKLVQPSLTPTLQNTKSSKVIKNYPVTTHAQMIEYRLKDKQSVYRVYRSLDKALVDHKLASTAIRKLRLN